MRNYINESKEVDLMTDTKSTGERILIVEDSGIIANRLENTLTTLGYDVLGAVPSGEEALQKVNEMPPDLVLMDIYLAGDINGIETVAQIQASFDIPVVYLTAYTDATLLQQAKITEPYGYLVKPIQDRELHATIGMALYKHEMEKKLKESEEWLSTTLRSIGDAVISTDAKTGVKFLNPVAQALTGWKEEDAVGKPLDEVFSIIKEETGERVESPATRVIREGVVVGLANRTVLIAKDGTRIQIADSGAPIKDNKGNTIGVVLVFRDVTMQRKMEQELQKNQRLESLGILAGGIAHDFNNILTGIVGNLSLARIETEPDKISERLEEVEKASLQAANLSQRLLTFSRGGAPIKEITSIATLIKHSAEFALMGSSVRCEYSIPDNLWTAEVDRGQMNQVFNNLIINADQAMPEGGILKVRAYNVTVSAEDALPLEDGEYIKIEIEDEGVGISEEHRTKIFYPYFTTKQKGSGLGLATTYSIIHRHDGYITVESELEVGTTFYIYLPASREESREEKVVDEQPSLGKGKILVMDDEEIVRDVAGSMLKHAGYEVESAKDGTEVIEMYKQARKSEQPFDAVIMDLTIPGGMGGEEAIKELLNIDPNVKAIASSGYSDSPVMANFRQYGFSGVVAKPYQVTELSEMVRNVIAEM